MREILETIFEHQPLDPTEAARRSVRPQLRRRFYKNAEAGAESGGVIPVLLDGRPVRTPARRTLAAPVRALAEQMAAEWNAQDEKIDPATMPLTRLASTIIDAVADAATGRRRDREIPFIRFAVLSRRRSAGIARALRAALGSA